MRRRLLTLLAAVLGGATFCSAAGANDLFAQGNAAYRSGDFTAAAADFQASADRQPAAGTLLNLGLAEWQLGHGSAALLAWEQARWLNPLDARPPENLRFARQVLQLEAPELKWYEAASTWLPPNAWFWLAGVSLWLAVGLVTLPEFLGRRRAGWQQTVAAMALGVFLFALTASVGVVSRTQVGLVTRKDAALRLTPTPGGEIMAALAAGESARKLRTRGDYFYIRTPGAAGWIERAQFKFVCPD